MVEQKDLFLDGDQEKASSSPSYGGDEEARLWEVPLAERLRPTSLDDFVGQQHLMAPGKPLRSLIETGRVPSCILYGPPGVGKTTLVRLMASLTGRKLLEVNAVTAKVAQLREMADQGVMEKRKTGRAVIAFVDEIYHFNSQQQNVLLPFVERGDLILVGTTTENPYFEINKTLLSRMIVYELKPLTEGDLAKLLSRALTDERGLGKLKLSAEPKVLGVLARLSGGDARQALMRLETVAQIAALKGLSCLTEDLVSEATGKATLRYDRASDTHYAVISALIKSMRGSDPDAAVYWLARMLSSGDDVRFIARRICIFASEDVGLADPQALQVAAAAAYACDVVGLPEAALILSEAVLYMATAVKSNSSYLALQAAQKSISEGDLLEVPFHLKPGGAGYVYPHDDPRHWVPQTYLPEPRRFYHPGVLGYEAHISERMKRFWKRFQEEGEA